MEIYIYILYIFYTVSKGRCFFAYILDKIGSSKRAFSQLQHMDNLSYNKNYDYVLVIWF